jgi:predicted enzyme related to lactoylglutathione lyase
MAGLLVNIDVPDLAAAERFYAAALALTPGRYLRGGTREMLGLEAPVYLIETEHGSVAAPGGAQRDFARHWCPIHLDIAVDDLDAAAARAEEAGARRETPLNPVPYGRIATFADPFGHGFCLVEFNREGYHALA